MLPDVALVALGIVFLIASNINPVSARLLYHNMGNIVVGFVLLMAMIYVVVLFISDIMSCKFEQYDII